MKNQILQFLHGIKLMSEGQIWKILAWKSSPFFFFLMEQHFYCNTYTSNSIIKNKFLSLAHPDATSSCFNFGPYFLPHAGFQPAVEDEGYCSVLERRKYLLLCFEFTKQNALFFKLCSELCVLSYS